jgi:hypothetical protein
MALDPSRDWSRAAQQIGAEAFQYLISFVIRVSLVWPLLEHRLFRLLAGLDVLFNLARRITAAAQPMPEV